MFFIPPINLGAGSGYTGPGDVVGGAVAWWGLRAYKASTIGANAIRLREDGGNTEQDFAIIAGGGLNLAAISAFKGANNLFVVKVYDQVGVNHFVQATVANQPQFTLSGVGSLPIMTFVFASKYFMTSTLVLTQAQPFTHSFVLNNTGIGSQTTVVGHGNASGPIQVGFNRTSANEAYIYAGGSVPLASETDGTWHAFQFVFNGASSDTNIDAVVSTGDVGTGNWNDVVTTMVLGDQGQLANLETYNGKFAETGLWPSAFSSADSTAMSANQHAYWGF